MDLLNYLAESWVRTIDLLLHYKYLVVVLIVLFFAMCIYVFCVVVGEIINYWRYM